MAILYAPPQPFAPAIAQAYGAAEVMTRNNPVLLNAAQESARMRLAQANAAADRQAQASAQAAALAQRQTEANYRNLQQAALADADVRRQDYAMADRRSQFGSELGARAAMQAAAQRAEMQQQQARYQVQMEMQQMELSQAERLRMQRLEAGITAVGADPDLNDQDKALMIAQLKADLNPYQMRMARFQQKQEEAAVNRMVSQQKLVTALQTGDQVARGQALEQMLVPRPNPAAPGGFDFYYVTPNGNVEKLEQTEPGKAETLKIEPFDITKAVAAAEAQARVTFPPDVVDKEKGTESTSQEQLKLRNEFAQQRFREIRDAHEARQQQASRPGVGAGAFEQGAAMGGVAGVVGGMVAPPAPRAEAPPPDATPWDVRTPKTRAQSIFKERTQAEQAAVLGRTDIPPAQALQVSAAMTRVLEIVAKWGSPEKALTSPDREKLLEEQRKIDALPPVKPPTVPHLGGRPFPVEAPRPTAPLTYTGGSPFPS